MLFKGPRNTCWPNDFWQFTFNLFLSQLNTSFDISYGFKILIDLNAITSTDAHFETFDFSHDRIKDTAITLNINQANLWVSAITGTK